MVSFIRLSRSSVVHDNGLLVHGDNGGSSSSAGSARGGDSSLGGSRSSDSSDRSEFESESAGVPLSTGESASESFGSLVGTN